MNQENQIQIEFIKQIKRNLEGNGFPQKKVSFPLEKMYELADKKELNFNKIREELSKEGILSTSSEEKIIFSQENKNNSLNDQVKQAKEMFDQMSDEEKKNIFQQFQSMSQQEKEEMFKKAKEMGITP